jgi:sec-independent protein translocase protein TatA
MPLALLNDVGGGELLVIGIAALLLFGRDLPVIARKFGRLVAEFKRGMADASIEIRREMNAAADEVEDVNKKAAAAGDVSQDIREIDGAVRKSFSEASAPCVKPQINTDEHG